jgi:hypothetical protein
VSRGAWNSRTGAILFVALLLSCSPLSAQTSLGPRRQADWPRDARPLNAKPNRAFALPAPEPAANMVVAGALTAAVSLVGGALLGMKIEERWFPCDCELSGLTGAVSGAIVLPMVAIPTAVHGTNHGQGSYVETTALSIGAGVVGAMTGIAGRDLGLAMLAPLPLEVIAAVLGERGSTK